MSTPNGTGNGTDQSERVTGAHPVILVRYRPERTSRTASLVHLAPLPDGGAPSALTSLCGILLCPEDIEQVVTGQGTPCSLCLVSHVSGEPSPDIPPDPVVPGFDLEAGPSAAAATYRDWGWAVTVRRDQVWLALGYAAVALMIPRVLAIRLAALLTERRCAPAILTHPYAPEHQVLLAGEPYPAPLPWPPEIHRVTTSVMLPPTMTPRGPFTWAVPPYRDALRLCREIDVLAALRSIRSDPPPGPPPAAPLAF